MFEVDFIDLPVRSNLATLDLDKEQVSYKDRATLAIVVNLPPNHCLISSSNT